MAKYDIHNHIAPKRAISPNTAITDNTALVSQVLDMQGFNAAELIILTGALADADATFTVLVEDSDQSGSGFVAVVDNELLGTEVQASFLFSDDDKVFKIGYVGNKRYVRATITPANNTGAANIAAVWVLGAASIEPTANPPV